MQNKYSKAKIDKAGKNLRDNQSVAENNNEDMSILNFWREEHLKPLTDVTQKLVEWLNGCTIYNINLRLKRRPQIIKKLKRKPNMRLTQMRDIGGCRAIFESNNQLDEAREIICEKAKRSKFMKIVDIADYRKLGRSESGYRALHITVERNGYKIEIQLRTKVQHFWAEAIERTSILCGSSLKEGEGKPDLIEYFHFVSDALFKVDNGEKLLAESINELLCKEKKVEIDFETNKLQTENSRSNNNNHIKAMVEREKSRHKQINNWILIFNWKTASFMHWAEVPSNSEAASIQYSQYEKNWPYEDGYEVVLIGSGSVESIIYTHSHYFGIESFDNILLKIRNIAGYNPNHISDNAYTVLQKLYSHSFWNSSSVSYDTLKNHYCKITNLESSLKELDDEGLIYYRGSKRPIYMLSSERDKIEYIINEKVI